MAEQATVRLQGMTHTALLAVMTGTIGTARTAVMMIEEMTAAETGTSTLGLPLDGMTGTTDGMIASAQGRLRLAPALVRLLLRALAAIETGMTTVTAAVETGTKCFSYGERKTKNLELVYFFLLYVGSERMQLAINPIGSESLDVTHHRQRLSRISLQSDCMSSSSKASLNAKVLRRHDATITNVIDSTSYVVLYQHADVWVPFALAARTLLSVSHAPQCLCRTRLALKAPCLSLRGHALRSTS